MARHRLKPSSPDFPPLTQVKAAPRGLLLHYILHSISTKPRHGYEILQDIESKTGGAWRPGVGSVYPMLKRLLAQGYIQSEANDGTDNRRVYRITPKGLEEIRGNGNVFANSSERWMAMRRLFFDMLDPAGVSSMFVEGSRKQFEITKELLDSRKDALSRNEVEFMLREYSLNLERQLDWTKSQLRDLKSRPSAPRLG